MLPVVTPQKMREIERIAIEEIGIDGRVLMEHAGRALAVEMMSALLPGESVGVVCGRGNNGGDGFVAARFLDHAGVSVHLYLAAEPDRHEGDARESLRIAQNLNLPITLVNTEGLADSVDFSRHDWLVDCLLGTGTRGEPRAHYKTLIEAMNASGAAILACDQPSGLDGETGRAEGVCVRAAMTVAIGLPKPGLLLYPGAGFAGGVIVADIGVPRDAIDRAAPDLFLVERSDAADLIPERPTNAHKGVFGRAFLLCGSRGMTGAAALATGAVLRVGAGLATVGVPISCNDAIEAKLTEATSLPLPETSDGALSLDAEKPIRESARRVAAIAVGSGLSRSLETAGLLRRLYDNWQDMPPKLVIDADGLNAVAPLSRSGVQFPKNAILTPHSGEMGRLRDVSSQDIEADRIGHARALAHEQSVYVVLKGAPTVIATPTGAAFLNPTGNPGMATGGSGDVLTGVLTGLLAQGLDPFDATILGVYLHGLAGDLAARRAGAGLLAGDVLRAVPKALSSLTATGTLGKSSACCVAGATETSSPGRGGLRWG